MRHGTYSIVARDPATGALGCAVQSHWFSVGSLVTWAQPGVGAACTQSVIEVAYGPRALEGLAAGQSAPRALGALLAEDPLAPVRQVAVVDAAGRVACHTGPDCIPHAGDEQDDGVSCQANMMATTEVPGAMLAAFRAAAGQPLAERLVAALDGAESAGGDVRGRQSAALVVAPPAGEPWRREVDLRVEDHPDPLAELRRLLVLQRAYALASQADELMGAGRPEDAAPLYARASALAPESDELLFWAGLGTAQAGDLAAGADQVRRAIAAHAGWATLLERLSPDFAPAAARVRAALRAFDP